MARFRAFSSDNSSSDSEEEEQTQIPKTVPPGRRFAVSESESEDEDEDEDEQGHALGESESESEMDEDELLPSPPRPAPKAGTRGKNALVEDEDGEIRYVHEVEHRVPSTSPSAKGGKQSTRMTGDPSVIPRAQHIGMDSSRMHQMQASFFDTERQAQMLKELNEPNLARPRFTAAQLNVPSKGFVNRKHSRDSDGDGLRLNARERASFAHDVDPPVFKPSRKYARVETTSSLAAGNEGSYADAGLAFGGSFRVGWGPGGRLVHLGSICGPYSKALPSRVSSVVTIARVIPTTSPSVSDADGTLSPLPPLAVKLLQHHLSHTTISRNEQGIPASFPSTSSYRPPSPSSSLRTPTHAPASSPEPLNFASFASTFPTTEFSNPAPIFRLGRALFDPMDLRLGRPRAKNGMPQESSVTPDIRNRVQALRRRNALSLWLIRSAKPSVDADLRTQSNGSAIVPYTPADAAFTYLTGHEIGPAADKAVTGGYIRLATLIAQAGGDGLFKDDLIAQLEIWKAEKLSPGSNANFGHSPKGLVERGVWRIYRLLAGLLYQEDEKDEDSILAGLDWKRVFALCMWYGCQVDSPIAEAVNVYERLLLQTEARVAARIARPIPKWATQENASQAPSQPIQIGLFLAPKTSSNIPDDPLYALIKLQADPALSLSHALNPLSFGPTPLGFGIAMCWHLYIVLSRVMRVRDFADRVDPALHSPGNGKAHGKNRNAPTTSGDEDDLEFAPKGYSATADLLTSSYALELESWGMIQEAVFVLMHLEMNIGREKAIKDLLTRNAHKIDEWVQRGLLGSLKLPSAWIDEAKGLGAFDNGDMFAAYELYLSAKQFNAAHNIAVLELAPDAIIRGDLHLLEDLFTRFDANGKRDKVDGWFVRGKIFLDYVDVAAKLRKLRVDGEELSTEETDDLAKRIPKIIGLLPDALHRSQATDPRHPAALERMTEELTQFLAKSKPLLLDQIQPTIGVLDSASKINVISKLGYARFLQSIDA